MPNFEFPSENTFKSKSDSHYFYSDDGVFRKSNHWGRVADCRWRLISENKIKSQNFYIGFAKWTDFYPLNEKEKQFYITVDFEKKIVNFHHKETKENVFLFFAETAQKRVEQIRKLLSDDAWTKYYEQNSNTLIKNIITQFINSNASLQEIKRDFAG